MKKKKRKKIPFLKIMVIIILAIVISLIIGPILTRVIEYFNYKAGYRAVNEYAEVINDSIDEYLVANNVTEYVQEEDNTITGLNVNYESYAMTCPTIKIQKNEVRYMSCSVNNSVYKFAYGYKTYKDGDYVYFNPEKGKKCTDYIIKQSKTGVNTGCMKWYTFSDSEYSDEVYLILDHNSTGVVAYNSTGDNSVTKELEKAIKKDTRKWEKDLQVRLLTVNELVKLLDYYDWNKEDNLVLETTATDATKIAKGNAKYSWLFNNTNSCEKFGCAISDLKTFGYWTSTAYKDSTNEVWILNNSGKLMHNSVSEKNLYGFRPVINVSKEVLN